MNSNPIKKSLAALASIILIAFCASGQSVLQLTFKDIGPQDIMTGAQRTTLYYPWLQDKKIAVVANQTSMIGNVHLVDSLVNARFDVVKVFCPEHGFRGDAEAGEKVLSYTDTKTGLPVVSLYGSKKKPSADDLKGIDVVVFDIQDVGVRFYTYISTMSYVMEACAENNIQFIVLDRPNPNGHYVDGPVLEKEFSSFIGLHCVPLVHGMTVAEYACMVNGEGWLKGGIKCDLKYVPVYNYNHTLFYQLPIKPSPNLPNMEAVYLYPTLGLFEGTFISVGRGTDKPFQVIGHPDLPKTDFSFTPKSIPGMALHPPFEGKECNGYDLGNFADEYIKNTGKIYLYWIKELYRSLGSNADFFNSGFDRVAGNSKLKYQIIMDVSEDDIRASWQQGISDFKKIRKKYLLYTDFE
ncbi:MAG: DUF1343 domain-containing protein [Bacteroidota bacterium]